MAGVDQKRKEEHGGLSVARAEFASSLGRRLEAIQAAIQAFEQQTQSATRRDNLIRRLHALGASAKVLGFAAAAECLSRAEQQLRTGLPETLGDDLLVVRDQLATLPTLVLRGTYSMLPAPPSLPPGQAASPAPLAQGPWCVLVCGSAVLADNLRSGGSTSQGLELIHTQGPTGLREMCAMYGPDVVVLDGSLGHVEDLIHTLSDAPETSGAELVVALAEEGAAASLQQAGAHTVLASTLSPVSLWRAVNRTRPDDHDLPSAREPYGDMLLRDLCERVSREIRRGLLEAADGGAQSELVPLGEGTEIRAAIWSAVARVREIVTTQSSGRVQFGPGPEGSVVLATSAGMRGRSITDLASIDLTGRRVVVADDDPAVAWFVAGTLRAAGANVRVAQDGRRALNLVHQWWPEVVVSDVLMPGVDGFALCREIKRDVALRDVPVILLSWKEDLLFRLRELGADADAYLRKEASASTLVDRVRELLWPRVSLERRLRGGLEVRGRLDGITTRTLLDAVCRLERKSRILLRDASAHYDIRIRDRSLRAIARTRANGAAERGEAALAVLLGVSAGRFSVVVDDQPIDDDFAELSLDEVLRAPILRARAAQRVLSGPALGTVERVTLDPETFTDELSMLPLSLRPLVDELLRGTAPRQLLASGAASLRSLESLLSDAARRGAVRAITGASGEDLITREILALSAPISEPPAQDALVPPAMFSLQLSPSPAPAGQSGEHGSVQIGLKSPGTQGEADDGFDWTAEANWDLDVPPESEASVRAGRASPFSRPKLSAEWGAEKRTSPGVGKARKLTPAGLGAVVNPTPEVSTSNPSEPKQDKSQPNVHETPELSEVVAGAIAADAPVESASQVVELSSKTVAAVDETASSRQCSAADQASKLDAPGPAVQLRPVEVVAQPVNIVEHRERERFAAMHVTGDLGPREEEAVFPLMSSAAPEKRSQRNTPRPGSAVVPPEGSTTLSSELAPRTVAAVDLGDSRTQSEEASLEAVEQIGGVSPDGSALSSNSVKGDVSSTRVTVPGQEWNDEPQSSGGRISSWIVPLGLTVLTGFLSFAVAVPIIQRFKSNSVESAAASASTLESAEVSLLSSAPNSVSSGATASSAVQEPNELPSGVVVPPDKGLVVVKTGGVHSIFVDDEFVGRGPERVVPVTAGQHRVRVSLNGEEHTESVDAVVGRVVELSLEQPAK
jgi:CheY-like chemotaxis protein